MQLTWHSSSWSCAATGSMLNVRPFSYCHRVSNDGATDMYSYTLASYSTCWLTHPDLLSKILSNELHVSDTMPPINQTRDWVFNFKARITLDSWWNPFCEVFTNKNGNWTDFFRDMRWCSTGPETRLNRRFGRWSITKIGASWSWNPIKCRVPRFWSNTTSLTFKKNTLLQL